MLKRKEKTRDYIFLMVLRHLTCLKGKRSESYTAWLCHHHVVKEKKRRREVRYVAYQERKELTMCLLRFMLITWPVWRGSK